MFCIFITCSTSYFHIDQLTNLQNCMYAHLYTCVKFTNLNTYVCEWKIFFTEDFPLAVCKHEYEVSFVSHGSYSPVHFSNGSLNSCKWNLCTYTHSIVVLTYKFHIMDTRDMKLLSLEFTCTHFYPQMEKFCVQCQDCIFIPPPPFYPEHLVVLYKLQNSCQFTIKATDPNVIILYRYAATCFNQLRGHPQVIYINKTW